MAELQTTGKDRGRNRHTPRVDLTPMVDLGFILITFFIYTTTLVKPNAMEINTPADYDGGGTSYIDTATITIIPVAEHRFVYYNGMPDSKEELQTTDLKAMRDIIMQRQSALRHLPASFSKQAHQLHVIIKPADNSTYEDVVNILDEMLINKVPYYALTDISEEENKLLGEL
ncbi:MAG: biopolymer transporter ExbD [Chitinophagaceae bacterium]|nr:biopolymer transporter ExbD [Chitinophagaceae bacterium]MCB9046816.1 biopolymer transporter ExbD [Chitinophagales bacterium]